MSNIAYIRVSTEDQNTSRQEELFRDYKIDRFYKEKVSGKNIKDRPELQKMMDYVREGDVVYVESISRFGRSLQDLLNLINQLNEKGVEFKSLKEGDIDTTTPTGKLVFSIFASLAEFERETIRQRQAEGIAEAKKRGVRFGRPPRPLPENFEDVYDKWIHRELSIYKASKLTGMPVSTFRYRAERYRKRI